MPALNPQNNKENWGSADRCKVSGINHGKKKSNVGGFVLMLLIGKCCLYLRCFKNSTQTNEWDPLRRNTCAVVLIYLEMLRRTQEVRVG